MFLCRKNGTETKAKCCAIYNVTRVQFANKMDKRKEKFLLRMLTEIDTKILGKTHKKTERKISLQNRTIESLSGGCHGNGV